MEKLNKFWLGLIVGLIVPVLFTYAFIGVAYKGDLLPWQLMKKLYEVKGLSTLMAVSALPNLLVFYLTLHKEYWKAGKGILLAVMLYGMVVFYFYFKS